jgi:hypothetical protein
MSPLKKIIRCIEYIHKWMFLCEDHTFPSNRFESKKSQLHTYREQATRMNNGRMISAVLTSFIFPIYKTVFFTERHAMKRIRDSAGLRAGWSVGGGGEVRVPVVAGTFSHHRVRTDFGAHPASYPMGTGVKQPEREADHSSPNAIPPLSQYAFMAWCSVKEKAQGQI